MVTTQERIESQFLQRAVAAGVAGDLNDLAPAAEAESFTGYRGDPNDLREAIAAQEAARQQPSPRQLRPDYAPPAEAESPEYDEMTVDRPDFVTARFLLPDGSIEEVDLDVPPMTMERIEMFSWHQNQVQKAHVSLMNTGGTNVKGLDNARRLSKRAKQEFIKYAVPTFPTERFGQLLAKSFMELTEALDGKKKKAEGETDAEEVGGVPNR